MNRLSSSRLVSGVFAACLWLAPLPVLADSRPGEVTETDAAELIFRSVELLGLEYRYGGSTPAQGLDCSGFIRHIFREALGLTLPRRSDEMSQIGVPLRREQLRPGDLVFFNTLRRQYSHVGLYVGGDRFVHAPSTGNVIRIEPMTTPYWMKRFDGGRRIPLSNAVLSRDHVGLDRLIDSRVRSSDDGVLGDSRVSGVTRTAGYDQTAERLAVAASPWPAPVRSLQVGAAPMSADARPAASNAWPLQRPGTAHSALLLSNH